MLQGPPGAGKTLLARAVPGILPELSAPEALDVTKIYSVAGLVGRDRAMVRQRPFRAPHHTISHAGLVGGGSTIRPGEISLAHRGVLFLDEFPEYPGAALEALREPLESGSVTISRARGSLTFPARILLIAAMNPCPCGYYGDSRRTCSCNDSTVSRYQRRVSGPLLDRFDLFMDVPRVEYHELSGAPSGEPSAAVRERVEAARTLQRERLAATPHLTNAEMGPVEVREFCQQQLEADAEPLLSRRDGADRALGARVPPHPPGGAHDRRPRGQRVDQQRPPRRGDPVPAARSRLSLRALRGGAACG